MSRNHKLIAIGYMGDRRVYIDLTRAEAIRRYEASEGERVSDHPILEFSFDNEFWAYDVHETDE